MPLTPGTRLSQYEITAQLGAGGMGEVYRARDTRLGRDVALKLLPESLATDADRLMRFEREARTLASLNHPHIAQIYGLDQQALIMELVEGEDLAERLARGPVPLDESLAIATQITHALEAAHEAGIVHRDLKPANIKVRSDGVVKVLDFGLAKPAEPVGAAASGALQATITSPAMTAQGVILGTTAYMAPEQARGKSVDKRADIWAFGCVLFEMLTGRRPFSGDSVSDTLASVLKEAPPLELLPPETPAPLVRVLRRCLEKDPASRLRDIADARLDLEQAAAGAESIVAPDSRQRPASWLGRAGWAAAGLVVGAAVGVLAWRQDRAQPAPAARLALPGSAGILFTLTRTDATFDIAVLPSGSNNWRTVLRGGSSAKYLPSGHIVYAANGGLSAVGFNLRTLTTTTEPVPVAEGVVTKSSGHADFAVASNGTLAYVAGGPQSIVSRLVWLNRDGTTAALPIEPREYGRVRLSPDGGRIAVTLGERGTNSVWLQDLSVGSFVRLIPREELADHPLWHPDGRHIAYWSSRQKGLFSVAIDGSGDPVRLTQSDGVGSQYPRRLEP